MVTNSVRPQRSRAPRPVGFSALYQRAVPALVMVAALAVGICAVPSGAASAALAHSSHGHSKKTATSCSSYKAGRNGVVRTFCTGKATATITAGGATTLIKGGSCGKSGNYFTVNVGVVVGPGFKGTKPNYFGLDVPPTATAFSNAILSYTASGVSGYASTNSGTVAPDHKSGTFSGTDLQGTSVTGSFTC